MESSYIVHTGTSHISLKVGEAQVIGIIENNGNITVEYKHKTVEYVGMPYEKHTLKPDKK